MAKDLNVSLGLLAENFRKGLKQATRDLRRFSRQTEGIGRSLTQSLSIPLAGAGFAALKSAADIEKLEAQLTATSKSTITVAEQLERLRKIAEAPGLGFEQAVSASARLQALNFTAEQAEETIKQFGNAVARSGGGAQEFDGVVLALGQIISKGKITAEEINQLNERIFEIRPALERAFGTSNTEELQKLGISSEEFVAKITADFAKLDRVGPTLANSFENAGIALKLFFNDIGREILKVLPIREALNSVGDVLSNLSNRFQSLSDPVKRTIITIAGLAIAIGPAILGISTLASGLAVFLNPVGLVITGIAALAAGFIALYNNNETFRVGVQKLGQFLKATFLVALENTRLIFERLRPVIDVIRQNISGLIGNMSGLQLTGVPALNALRRGFELLGQAALFLYRTFIGVRRGIRAVFVELVEIAQETVKSFQDSFASLKQGRFTEAFNQLGQGLKNLNPVGLAINEGKRLGGAFLDSFRDGFNNDPITKFYEQVQAKIRENAETTKKVAEDSTGKITLPAANPFDSSFSRPGSSSTAEQEPRDDFSTITALPNIFNQVLPQAEQLQLITQALGATPLNIFPAEQLENLVKGVDETTNLQEATENFNKAQIKLQASVRLLGSTFDDTFNAIVSGSKNAFKAFTAGIKQVLIELGKAILKAALFAGIASLISPNLFNFKESFGSLFGQFSGLGSITSLANGGIIPNRTFLTGEEGAEAIIPLDRETTLPFRIEVDDIRIEGTDLILALRQSEGITNRLFG